MSRPNDARVYVGNLPGDVRRNELDDLFHKYGPIRDISIKSGGSGPAFAFVEFDDPRDASDAIYGRNGVDFAGARLRVERSNKSRGGSGPSGNRGRFTGRRSDYRVIVTGIPRTGSWQDLKDFMREAGEVLFSDVSQDGSGVVEFSRESDMLWALKNLDGKKFRTHLDESGYVTLREDRGRSRSRSRSPRRSRSRSPRRSRSPARRSSRSPARRSSRSPARKSSRSPSPRPDSPRNNNNNNNNSNSGNNDEDGGAAAKRSSRSPSPRRSASRSPRQD